MVVRSFSRTAAPARTARSYWSSMRGISHSNASWPGGRGTAGWRSRTDRRAPDGSTRGSGHDRSRHRSRHRLTHHATDHPAGPLRHSGPPSAHQAQHHTLPGRRTHPDRRAGPTDRRAPVARADIPSGPGVAAHARCPPGGTRRSDEGGRRHRPGQHRETEAPRPAAPQPHGPRRDAGAAVRRGTVPRSEPSQAVTASAAGGEFLARVEVAAQPDAGLSGVPRDALRCRCRPPAGEGPGPGGAIPAPAEMDLGSGGGRSPTSASRTREVVPAEG
ncbi:hypothetical protein SUDANB178_00026 [Streptomyces sp. enrichment culture]